MAIIAPALGKKTTNTENLRLCDLALEGCDKALKEAENTLKIQDKLIQKQYNTIESSSNYLLELEKESKKQEEFNKLLPYYFFGAILFGGFLGHKISE